MAKAKRAKVHGSDWYRSRAKVLKGWGLIGIDLRRSKTGAFSASEKRTITRLWNSTAPVHQGTTDSAKFTAVKAIKVKKSDNTGNRMRVKDIIFVATDGAQRVRLNRKTKTITKSIKRKGSRTIIRAPLNPKAQDLSEAFAKLSKNQTGMIRSATGKGIVGGGVAYDKNTFQNYAAWRLSAIEADYRKPGRNRDGSERKALSARAAKKKARQVLEDWYIQEVTDENE
jgi:hypothetical protein